MHGAQACAPSLQYTWMTSLEHLTLVSSVRLTGRNCRIRLRRLYYGMKNLDSRRPAAVLNWEQKTRSFTY